MKIDVHIELSRSPDSIEILLKTRVTTDLFIESILDRIQFINRVVQEAIF